MGKPAWLTFASGPWGHIAAIVAVAMFTAETALADCIDVNDSRPVVEQVSPRSGVEGRPAEGQSGPPAGPEPERRVTAPPMLGLTVSQAQVNVMRRVLQRLAAEAFFSPLVVICEDAEVNAYATNKLRGLSRSGVIMVTSAMMEFLREDENRVAALLSHEIAHLMEDHEGKGAAFERRAARRAGEVGAELESQRRGIGVLAARQYFVALKQAYSREIEKRADDVGYQLYFAAGFDPREATTLFQALRDRFGGTQGGYFASHPGWDDRIARLQALTRDDANRAQVAANAQSVAAESERYAALAEEHRRNRQWRELSQLVSRWLTALPESGLGWYYRGLLMRGSAKGKAKAWESFAKGVELDPSRSQIWEVYVESLEENGYRQEAVAAVAQMSAIGHPTWDLKERVFNDHVWVHGGARGSPPNLWWARDESGQRVIASYRGVFSSRGLEGQSVPPEWVPAQ